MTDDFLDSFAPFDDEIITPAWPLPAPNPWKPAPTLWERVKRFLIGEEAV